jgi:hypothetical protein
MDGLPPGFQFFPTDEELIAWYLAKKAVDASFTTAAIRDVDLYSFDPWDLPCTSHRPCFISSSRSSLELACL